MRARDWAVLAALAIGLSAASPVFAATSHTRTVTKTTGVEILGEALSRLDGIEISGDAVTVTVKEGGHGQAYRVGFDELAAAARRIDVDDTALLRLLVVPFGIASLFKGLRLAAAVTRRR